MNSISQFPNPANVQGLILRGYTHPFSCHLLFSFSGPGQNSTPQRFFQQIYPKVQSAADWGAKKPDSLLNVGLTFNGIKALGVVSAADIGNFPPEFQAGPWSGGSQQSLADVYDPKSVPSSWWNQNFSNQDLHCAVHVYGLDKVALDSLVDFVASAAQANGVRELLPLAKTQSGGRLYQSVVDNDKDKIHFGYRDGISEPPMDNSGRIGLPNAGDVNNFVIGYPNGSICQPGPTGSDTASVFAHDGCYNAFRVLYQDVAAFNTFLTQQAQASASSLAHLKLGEKGLEEWFAAKLCGRWRNGSPLMLSPDKPDPDTATGENFGFMDQGDSSSSGDVTSGAKCPFSAHTRISNPRNQALAGAEGTFGPPRILRRGMPYGPTLTTDADDGTDRGLIGIFLCGSIASQFERLYGWINYNSFSPPPVYSLNNPPQDPLLGNRGITSDPNTFPGAVTSFTIPMDGSQPITIPNLPQFVRTRGTAYFLLPSLSALRTAAGIAS